MFGSQKLLVDTCLPLVIVEALRQEGHDVTWVVDLDPPPSDEELLALADAEDRTLMTIDPYMDQALTRWVDRKSKAGIVWLRILPLPEMVKHAISGALAIPRMQWINWKYSLRRIGPARPDPDKDTVPAVSQQLPTPEKP